MGRQYLKCAGKWGSATAMNRNAVALVVSSFFVLEVSTRALGYCHRVLLANSSTCLSRHCLLCFNYARIIEMWLENVFEQWCIFQIISTRSRQDLAEIIANSLSILIVGGVNSLKRFKRTLGLISCTVKYTNYTSNRRLNSRNTLCYRQKNIAKLVKQQEAR